MLLQAAATPAPDPGALAARNALFIALGIFTLGFLIVFVRALRARAAAGESIKSPIGVWPASFVANFLDTLGIGSFATTTSMFRHWKLVPDEKMPGTLNVGYVLPTVAQAYIYTTIVPVDPTTLVLMIGASVLGAWLGAGVVSSWPRRSVQIGMGLCLLGAAVLFTSQQLNLTPGGGTLLKLTGAKLIAAVLGNFLLGALMTLGIGLYGPCMILISLLGMNPTAAFPIMMGSCAFLMPMASVRFIRTGGYDVKAMLGMMLAGLPAVLIAAFIVKSMDLYIVKWLVVVVVTYTGINLLRSASRERRLAAEATAAEAAPA
jgi:uncharacterized membrane protein YfcA